MRTSSIAISSVWPARAPRTSIGPMSACPASSSRRVRALVLRLAPARVEARERDRVSRSTSGSARGRARSDRAASAARVGSRGASLRREQPPHRVDDALHRWHVRVLDLPVRIRHVVSGDPQDPPWRSKIAFSASTAATSAPNPATRGASWTTTARPVLATDPSNASSSSGLSDRR